MRGESPPAVYAFLVTRTETPGDRGHDGGCGLVYIGYISVPGRKYVVIMPELPLQLGTPQRSLRRKNICTPLTSRGTHCSGATIDGLAAAMAEARTPLGHGKLSVE